jgi:hypothetical protein
MALLSSFVGLTGTQLFVQSGLVVNLDAQSSLSYPGSGTTWFDLSGNNNNATVTNGLTVNSSPSALNFTTSQTMFLTLNLASTNNTVTYLSRQTGGSNGRVLTSTNNWLMGYHAGTQGDYYAEGWVNDATDASDTTWRVFTGTGNISTDS